MITARVLAETIDRWVEDLDGILASEDPARDLQHLRASMVQARTSVLRLGLRGDDIQQAVDRT